MLRPRWWHARRELLLLLQMKEILLTRLQLVLLRRVIHPRMELGVRMTGIHGMHSHGRRLPVRIQFRRYRSKAARVGYTGLVFRKIQPMDRNRTTIHHCQESATFGNVVNVVARVSRMLAHNRFASSGARVLLHVTTVAGSVTVVDFSRRTRDYCARIRRVHGRQQNVDGAPR